MADIVLLRPAPSPYREIDSIPWGIVYVGGVCREHGYDVKIIDQLAEDDWREALAESLASAPICVGISSITGYQIAAGLEMARRVRELAPGVPLVWGGVHPSILPAQTLAHELVDIVVRGEGEVTFLEVVRALESKKGLGGIRGAWYKSKGRVCGNDDREFMDLSRYPRAWRSLIDPAQYIRPIPAIQAKRAFELCTSRGCPCRCTFCYNNIYNNRWRSRDVDSILSDLKELRTQHHIDWIDWREDNFFHDKGRVEILCREMIRNGLETPWSANCRVDRFIRFKPKLMDLLVQSGCRSISLGAESGSTRMLKLLAKGISPSQILDSAKNLKNYGLGGYYQFMAGFPTESRAEVLETVRLIEEILRVLPEARFQGPSLYTPYPGTPLFEECVKHGFVAPDRLEGWSKLEWDRAHLPWLARRDRRFLRRVRYTVSPVNKFGPPLNRYFHAKLAVLSRTGTPLPCPELLAYNLLTTIKRRRSAVVRRELDGERVGRVRPISSQAPVAKRTRERSSRPAA